MAVQSSMLMLGQTLDQNFYSEDIITHLIHLVVAVALDIIGHLPVMANIVQMSFNLTTCMFILLEQIVPRAVLVVLFDASSATS
jgi:hypothetical protein